MAPHNNRCDPIVYGHKICQLGQALQAIAISVLQFDGDELVA